MWGLAHLVPYLNNITETIVKCFQLYQLNNKCYIYDTVGALAWAVGPEMEKPQYMQ